MSMQVRLYACFICVYMCVYTSMHVHAYMYYLHSCTVCIYMHACIYTYVCICVHVPTRICVRLCTCSMCLHACVHAYLSLCIIYLPTLCVHRSRVNASRKNTNTHRPQVRIVPTVPRQHCPREKLWDLSHWDSCCRPLRSSLLWTRTQLSATTPSKLLSRDTPRTTLPRPPHQQPEHSAREVQERTPRHLLSTASWGHTGA